MAGLDEESGLLKPTVQKTRGLTALVVAAAALSFFAGAVAATHATTTTELEEKKGCTSSLATSTRISRSPVLCLEKSNFRRPAPSTRRCPPFTGRFSHRYDEEVQEFLKKRGYKGLLLKPRKNNQDNCPDVIYEPNAFDPSTPPPVLAADQEATSSSCTRDAYGKCVPAGCASYFDGCNTCNVGAVLGCTMMYCDKPQEP